MYYKLHPNVGRYMFMINLYYMQCNIHIHIFISIYTIFNNTYIVRYNRMTIIYDIHNIITVYSFKYTIFLETINSINYILGTNRKIKYLLLYRYLEIVIES